MVVVDGEEEDEEGVLLRHTRNRRIGEDAVVRHHRARAIILRIVVRINLNMTVDGKQKVCFSLS